MGKRGEKKATMMFCKYYVHCQLGSMIEVLVYWGWGSGERSLALPFQPREFVCLLVIIIGLGYIGMMESF